MQDTESEVTGRVGLFSPTFTGRRHSHYEERASRNVRTLNTCSCIHVLYILYMFHTYRTYVHFYTGMYMGMCE